MEYFLGLFFAAVLGAVLGSFINVVILRWHAAAGLWGRSVCPDCGTTLRARHLVPVLSWLSLRGRCATCRAPISIQYPLVELAAIGVSLLAAIRHDPFTDIWQFLFEAFIGLALLVPVVMDLRWKELPVEYLLGVGVVGWMMRLFLVSAACSSWSAFFGIFVRDMGAIAGISLFFLLQILASRGRWVGVGDVWFGAMMGALLGWPRAFIALYLAYLIGGTIAVIGLVSGRVRRGQRIPFAPMLASGTLLALWYGQAIFSSFYVR